MTRISQRVQSRSRAVRRACARPSPLHGGGVRGDSNDLFAEQRDGVAYSQNELINSIRAKVDAWRGKPEREWGVTPETARLLKHWRTFDFADIRPFFCQIEAIETLIWLVEVAPGTKDGKDFLARLREANADANPELDRLALKLATGTGKTTVMAMIIAWQTINAHYHRTSPKFTNGFLVCTPGLTIRDRLRVLKPSDPEAYYKPRQLVPQDYLPILNEAKVVITNYHAFRHRTKAEFEGVGKKTKTLLFAGADGAGVELETEGEMLRRVMPELMGLGRVLILNDEAHHCYRHRVVNMERKLEASEKEEAKANEEMARLWISGLEAVRRHIDKNARTIDLSATPFFLRGSGYQEGTLFPWTVSDFSLMDALECGIVKLPRIPIDDTDKAKEEWPVYRKLWEHIRQDMPANRRTKGAAYSVNDLPDKLRSAIHALYGHYEKVYKAWTSGPNPHPVPPCFIFVCQNTVISKLVYDLVSGYAVKDATGDDDTKEALCELFSNYVPKTNEPYAIPRTILVDSAQLESGESLTAEFHKAAAKEIEDFKRELISRTGDRAAAEKLSDEDLLREVMNTVGKEGRLGGGIRCVVSVSMLTEGWDANNVTHILGVRAFGTQLICEQVVGRALRRRDYTIDPKTGLFAPEYADIFGIPFDFVSKPTRTEPPPPPDTVRVKAIRPERDRLAIVFPHVRGYYREYPADITTWVATFDDTSTLILKPEMLGPAETVTGGIAGEKEKMGVEEGIRKEKTRKSTIVAELTNALLNQSPKFATLVEKTQAFSSVKNIVVRWIAEGYLKCEGGMVPAQLLYPSMLKRAVEILGRAIEKGTTIVNPEARVRALIDSYNPQGTSANVNFTVSRKSKILHETAADKSHVNYAVCDSAWEETFCRVVEAHPKTLAYVRNAGLGFEVPYFAGGERHSYLPDFIVLVDDGHGRDNPLHLIVEIKGYRYLDTEAKKATVRDSWVPGVNAERRFGRWAFIELTDQTLMEADYEAELERLYAEQLATVTQKD